MTIEMQDALNRELEDAKAISDADRRREAMDTVQGHMLAALIDCQRKTAERVKWIRTAFLLLAVAILVLITAGPETLKEMITLSKVSS